MDKIIQEIREKSRRINKTIILPEGNNPKVLEAAIFVTKYNLAKIILTGNKTIIERKARFANLDLSNIEVINSESKNLVFSLNLLAKNKADGLVAGIVHTTKEVYKNAFKIIGTKEKNKIASTFFIMSKGFQTYIFSDCALNIDPDAKQLSTITIDTVNSAKKLGLVPKVALLSYSTKGSATHRNIKKIKDALKIIKKNDSTLKVDGELQVDTAIIPSVSRIKNPNSDIRGDANILIFPDLNSGNIAYKLTERLAGFNATGPISQGLKKPVNDLSRGCKVDDIINAICITVIQANTLKE